MYRCETCGGLGQLSRHAGEPLESVAKRDACRTGGGRRGRLDGEAG